MDSSLLYIPQLSLIIFLEVNFTGSINFFYRRGICSAVLSGSKSKQSVLKPKMSYRCNCSDCNQFQFFVFAIFKFFVLSAFVERN